MLAYAPRLSLGNAFRSLHPSYVEYFLCPTIRPGRFLIVVLAERPGSYGEQSIFNVYLWSIIRRSTLRPGLRLEDVPAETAYNSVRAPLLLHDNDAEDVPVLELMAQSDHLARELGALAPDVGEPKAVLEIPVQGPADVLHRAI